jgi:hypothetical protein
MGNNPICCRYLKLPVYFHYSDVFILSSFSCVSETCSVVAYFPSYDNRNVCIVYVLLLLEFFGFLFVLLASMLLNL